MNKFLLAVGVDPPKEFPSRKKKLLENLEQLQATLLPSLLILTNAAQQSTHRDLEKWLQQLYSALYDAQHVLGLVEYKRLEKEVNSHFHSTSKFNFKKLKAILPQFSSKKNILTESLEKLEKVVTKGIEFSKILDLPSTDNLSPALIETISWSPIFVGRDQDRGDIITLLRDDHLESPNNKKCYSVMAIWGMGGSGKTALARNVWEIEKKKTKENKNKYFDRVIWVHVPRIFNVRTIWEKIWESALEKPCPKFTGLEVLYQTLRNKLRGQKFFLVLDDVWWYREVKEDALQQLFAPLSESTRGSKILVTTRIKNAAIALGAMEPIQLRELNEEQFFLLFKEYVINNGQTWDNAELMLIVRQIATKLCRSPLAAQTVAGQLRQLDKQSWPSMPDKGLLSNVMNVLYSSYQDLQPAALKRCFAFCSLFPKGHEFDHDHLVNLWIAEGFIETEDSDQHIKDIATKYILELVSCSFFQVNISKTNHYFMQDLTHLLAQHVSQSECFQIGSGERKEIPAQTRHLYVVPDMLGEYVEKICKLNDLCTIVVPGLHDYKLEEVHLDALFMNLTKLCVVELPHIRSLPKSVINLRNLRYLKFYADVVGESVTKLYQLRFLFCGENLKEIPNVGRLMLLQELREFCVRKRRGFELKQLEHLTNLFGSLSIYGLHHVGSKEEANQAKLSEKKGLQILHFYWDHESENIQRNNDVEILNGLCPPPQIREVAIKGYSCNVLPGWIFENNDSLIECLELADCKGLEALPRLNKLSNLNRLEMNKCANLTSLSELPPTVKSITIRGCNEEFTRSCNNPLDLNGKKVSHILEKDIQQ